MSAFRRCPRILRHYRCGSGANLLVRCFNRMECWHARAPSFLLSVARGFEWRVFPYLSSRSICAAPHQRGSTVFPAKTKTIPWEVNAGFTLRLRGRDDMQSGRYRNERRTAHRLILQRIRHQLDPASLVILFNGSDNRPPSFSFARKESDDFV
jgi:hypothetical protein